MVRTFLLTHICLLSSFVETAKKKIQRAENAKQEDITKLEPIDADTKDMPPEKKTKKSKKSRRKKSRFQKTKY